MKNTNLFFRLLQLSAFAVFLGRAWQHLYWDAPFRALFWDEAWLSGIITNFTSMSWETYITSEIVENRLILLIKFVGVLYLICAFISLFIKKLPSFFRLILILGTLNLTFLAFLYAKEKFFNIGQFFEYSLQFCAPLFLILFVKNQSTITTTFLRLLKIAIALTFTCHGLYAIGFYPRPALFIEMTMNILPIGEEQAISFLNIAGILDFIISIGIFFPWKWGKYFLMYAILWGFLTTTARIWAHFNLEWLDYVLLQWLHESIMRMPHFLIPLAVFFAYNKQLVESNAPP